MDEQYLWIDALCINQSDELEKTQQLQIMGEIYTAALLTVISPCSSSVHSSIPGARSNSRRSKQIDHRISGHVFLEEMDPLETHLNSGKWATRAWTYQEACLSRRCLILTCERAYLACPGHVQGEGSIRNTHAGNLDESDHWKHVIFDGKMQSRRSGLHFAKYASMVGDYTARALGYSADSLTAFNGVLSKLNRWTRTSFHYGLPISHLHKSLLWSVLYKSSGQDIYKGSQDMLVPFSRSETQKLLTTEAIPTWSWAKSITRATYEHVGCEYQNGTIRSGLVLTDENVHQLGLPWAPKITFPTSAHVQIDANTQEIRLDSFAVALSARNFPAGFERFAYQVGTNIRATTIESREYSYEYESMIWELPWDTKLKMTVILDHKPSSDHILGRGLKLLHVSNDVSLLTRRSSGIGLVDHLIRTCTRLAAVVVVDQDRL